MTALPNKLVRAISAIVIVTMVSGAFLPVLASVAEGPAAPASRGSRSLQGFTESSQGLPGNLEYVSITVGYFNNDNYLDIASGILAWQSANDGMDAWVNNNGASYTQSSTGLPTDGGFPLNFAADIDKDGDSDLLLGHETGWSGETLQGVLFYKSDGAASPSWTAGTHPISTGYWESVAAADFSKDGNFDVVAASENSGMKAWKGDGGTTWTDTSTGLPTTGAHYGVDFGDFNEDGNVDIAVGTTGIKVYLGNGGTSWALSTGNGLPTSGSYLGINVTDVDNDGYDDIVAGSQSGGIEVWTGDGASDGTLTFTEESTGLVTSGFYSQIAVGDIDKDGNIDIFAGEAYGSIGVRLYLGDGGSGGSCDWTRYSQDLPANGGYTGAMMADMDNDGDLDLIASDSGLNAGGTVGISVYLSDVITINRPPVPNAGEDQTVLVGSTVHMDASNSTDPDKNPVDGLIWNLTSQPSGSSVQLDCSTALKPTFVPQKIGKYVFTLSVRDSKGLWGIWEDTINITANPWPNKKPTANAGLDKTAVIFTLVQLNGSLSTDDQPLVAYDWNMTGKPVGSAVNLSNEAIVNPTFTPDIIGLYKFTLTVKDSNNTWSTNDEVKITVNPAGTGPPVANAGVDQVIELGAKVTLNASASTDDQSIVAYDWSVAYEPTGSSIVLQDVMVQNITPTHEGYYDLSLKVKDNDNLWALQEDIVRITVLPKNLPPVAKIDKPEEGAAFLNTGTIDFDGSGSSDPEGKPVTLMWTSDKDGQLSEEATFTTNLSVGKHVITLYVKDDHEQTAIATVNIEVKLDTAPKAVLKADTTKILKGEKVNFDAKDSTDLEGTVAEYKFDFGDSTSMSWVQAPTTSHIYKSPGTYKATVTVKDNKGQSSNVSEPVTITVGDRPSPALTASVPVVKIKKVVTFYGQNSTDSDGTVVGYYFDFGDGTNSGWVNTTSVTHAYTVAKTYTVTLKVKDNDGYESPTAASITVTAEKPAKPKPSGLGSMMLPLLLILVVIVVLIVVAIVIMKRKAKGGAVQTAPAPAPGVPQQVDLIGGPAYPPPQEQYPGGYQQPPPQEPYQQQYQGYDQGQPQQNQQQYDPNQQAQQQYDPNQQYGQPPQQ